MLLQMIWGSLGVPETFRQAWYHCVKLCNLINIVIKEQLPSAEIWKRSPQWVQGVWGSQLPKVQGSGGLQPPREILVFQIVSCNVHCAVRIRLGSSVEVTDGTSRLPH